MRKKLLILIPCLLLVGKDLRAVDRDSTDAVKLQTPELSGMVFLIDLVIVGKAHVARLVREKIRHPFLPGTFPAVAAKKNILL